MTLNRRALQIILPVILLSYIAAFATVYQAQRQSLMTQEQVRTQLTSTRLLSSYARYLAFAESYINTVIQSTSFRNFVQENNDAYRDITLGGSLERTVRNYQQHESEFLSLALLNSNQEVLYYFENSTDPFAEISNAQKDWVAKLEHSTALHAWGHLPTAQGTRIVYSILLDPNTLLPPIPSQRSSALIVQLVLEASIFDRLREEMSENYRITLTGLNSAAPEKTAFRIESPLVTDFVLSVAPRPEYIESLLVSVRTKLLVITILFTLCSAALLVWLIRRNLTLPVSALEQAIQNVLNQKSQALIVPDSRVTELHNLGKSFQELYSQLSSAFQKTQTLAETDQLTGLHNLGYMTKAAAAIMKRARQQEYRVAFLYIDLDNFKFVNDRFGHDVGDTLLKTFSRRTQHLAQILRPAFARPNHRILISRIAGDEFGVIIEDVDPGEADLFSAELLQMFRGGFSSESNQFPVTASIGIALFPDHGHALSQLVSNADTAMYQAKAKGKNRFSYYSQELAQQMRRKRDIEFELKNLICDDEFFLVYMPLVNAATHQTTGVEVLVRWDSPKMGMVSPAEFIPIAENCGAFTKIDHWVILASLRDYASLTEQLGPNVKLSLNLSSAQLKHSEIATIILKETQRLGIKPENIQLEMTETVGVDYTQDVNNLLHTLRRHRFQIAIDDFGTGYTSLLQMVEYPVDMIKLDRTFIEKARQSQRNDILRPLIELCHAQGMKVTAEGVETTEDEAFLSAIGCDYLQGFLYGKPCRLNELKPNPPQEASAPISET